MVESDAVGVLFLAGLQVMSVFSYLKAKAAVFGQRWFLAGRLVFCQWRFYP